jgi:hypothetical protein
MAMSADSIFSICSSIAMFGWVILIVASPFWRGADKFLIGIVVTLLAIVYAWCIGQSFHPDDFQKFYIGNTDDDDDEIPDIQIYWSDWQGEAPYGETLCRNGKPIADCDCC